MKMTTLNRQDKKVRQELLGQILKKKIANQIGK
jgi:hypothetical protein